MGAESKETQSDGSFQFEETDIAEEYSFEKERKLKKKKRRNVRCVYF